jgi:hypothetical protein
MRVRLFVLSTVLAVACTKKERPTEQPVAEEQPPNPAEFAPSEEHEPPAPEEPPPPVDPYADLTEEQRTEKAKELYTEAEKLAKAKDWENAMVKYEEAYYLVPGKHGFAFKVGQAAHKAGHCAKAEQYLTHFQTYGDPEKHAKELKETKKILAVTAGCPGG